MAALVTFPSTTEKQRLAASMKTKFSSILLACINSGGSCAARGLGPTIILGQSETHTAEKKIVAGPPSCLKNEWAPTYSPLIHV